MVPAVKDGLLGALASELGQLAEPPARPRGPEGGSAPSGLDHGVRVEVVVLVPQVRGVVRAAPSPLKKCRSMSSRGSCGLSVKVALSCPVVGSGVTLPASLVTMPVSSSSIARYMAVRLPKGFS